MAADLSRLILNAARGIVWGCLIPALFDMLTALRLGRSGTSSNTLQSFWPKIAKSTDIQHRSFGLNIASLQNAEIPGFDTFIRK